MNVLDELKILIGGFYGIKEMDEYKLKVYVMEQIKEYINKFVLENKIDFNIVKEEFNKIENQPLKRKLQDLVLVFRSIDVPLELQLLTKNKIRELNKIEDN